MFVIPEDVRSLSDADLNEALAAALTEAEEFADLSDTEATPDQLDRVIALGEFAEAAHAELAVRADKAKRYAAAREALAVSRTPAETPDEAESLTAAAAAAQGEDTPTPMEAVSLVAAANVPGYSQGHKFADLTDLGQAVMSRIKKMPTGTTEKFRNNYSVAQIGKGGRKFMQGRDYDVTDLLLQAADEHALPGGSLVAAGGWGSPSETLYDLCTTAGVAGLIDIPEIGVTRGGISYTKGVSLADVLASATGWIDQTEAQAEAGTAKTLMTIDDPTFSDVRLDAVGLAIEAGILLRSAYPEVIKNVVSTALIGHQHKVSAKVIAKIIAIINSKLTIANGFGNALDTLHITEMVAMGERQRYKLPENASLEMVLPMWVKALIRADLAQRTGIDQFAVTDQQIVSFFSARNLRVQFVYNWQELVLTTGTAVAFPATVEALIYPAGTFVKGTSDVLTLDTVYDSTKLLANKYIELFTEEGVLVANPCNDGKHIDFAIAANGRTAAADTTGDLFVTGV